MNPTSPPDLSKQPRDLVDKQEVEKYEFEIFENAFWHVWTKFLVSGRFQLAIYTVFYVESDFADENSQILQGNEEI